MKDFFFSLFGGLTACGKFVAGFAGAIMGWYFGGWDKALQILLALAIVDYITGVIAAYINKTLSSKIGFVGLAKKVVMFLIVGIAVQVDSMIGQVNVLRMAVIIGYAVNESLSVIENGGRIGLPIPAALVKAIAALRTQTPMEPEPVRPEPDRDKP